MERKSQRVVLTRARGMILFSVLTAQLVLQVIMIWESEKNKEICFGEGFQLVRYDFSRIVRENIDLMLLHIFALVMHIFALLRSSTVFDLYLLMLFSLSAGCGLIQYFHVIPYCRLSKRVAALEIARLILAIISLLAFVGFTVFLRSSFFNPGETTYKASVPTVLFLTVGIVILAVGGNPNPTSWLFYYLWIVVTALAFFIAIVLPVLRHHSLKVREDEIPASNARDHPNTRLSFGIDVPIQSLSSDPNIPRNSLPIHEKPSSFETLFKLDHVAGPFSMLPKSKRVSILTETTRSARSSVSTETFYSAAHSRSSTETVLTVEPTRIPEVGHLSQRIRDSHHTLSSAGTTVANGLQLSPPYNNRHISISFPSNEDAYRIPSMARHSTSLQAMEDTSPLPERDNQTMTGSSFSLNVSSPTSRSSSVSTTTSTVPPYTDGLYSYRPRRDTLTSDRTYDTLPSYHSRQSSRTFPDLLVGPSALRNIRSLPDSVAGPSLRNPDSVVGPSLRNIRSLPALPLLTHVPTQ